MRFRWNGKQSKVAFVESAAIRVMNRGMELEKAIEESLRIHSSNPELLSDETLRRLRKEISDRLKEIEKGNSRRGGKRTAG